MRRIRPFLYLITLLVMVSAVMNLDVSIKQGVGASYRYVHMPLYVKWTQFLARHYEYARLVKEITRYCKTDEEKVLAVLNWTREHIRDVPKDMPVVDDHILNIIIRGYATPGQYQDVFTTLCTYAGIPAFWDRCYSDNHKIRYALSFVKIGGKWGVFDAYRGKYFRKNNGEIAAIEDIIDNSSLLKGEDLDKILVRGIPYREFYHNLQHVEKPSTSRAEKQMPVRRVIFEAKKLVGIEIEESDQ